MALALAFALAFAFALALALALALARRFVPDGCAHTLCSIVIIPKLTCWVDRYWNNIDRGRFPGVSAAQLPLPFHCPFDHLFDLDKWVVSAAVAMRPPLPRALRRLTPPAPARARVALAALGRADSRVFVPRQRARGRRG
eukprot:5863940-Prymnesium_polylepis.1